MKFERMIGRLGLSRGLGALEFLSVSPGFDMNYFCDLPKDFASVPQCPISRDVK